MQTPLGWLHASFDHATLIRLEFTDTPSETISPLLKQELAAYFAGELTNFQIPLRLTGTPFQIRVWQELQKIPYGTTRSYAEIAQAIGKPTAFRAVAQANGANPLSLIIPCHRVINTNGKLGGYNGGIHRKQWLLNHEISSVPSSRMRSCSC